MSFLSIGDIIKLYEIAERVYKNCRDCSGEYKALTVETRSLSNLLQDIQDKYDKIPSKRQQQLLDAYEPCIEVLQELDKILLRYNRLDTKSKRTWDRITYDPDRTRTMRERLTASVTMLTSFYTSLVHDSQYLILEALGRLEQDYRGGHREESIASIEQLTSGIREDEDQIEDQAWSQVLRDLEDVGISQQQALSYRNVIVDWLVLAVNEGRLLEERPEHDAASSMSPSTEAIPWEPGLDGTPHSPDIPANTPPTQTPSSTPLLEPLSTPNPTKLQLQVGSVPSLDTPPQSPISTPNPPPRAPFVIPQSIPGPPRSFCEQDKATTTDLEWNAHQVMEAWARNDFVAAEKHLGQQLAAVEYGQTCTSGTQPDRRILRHLLGVCASLTGKFTEAKRLFESVFNGIFLHNGNLDDGDIAAARWLGDVCLYTQEYDNAILAYSAAYEGSVNRFGVTHDWTQRVAAEIKLMDSRQGGFNYVERSFSLNEDPTTIFISTNVKEKGSLVLSVKSRLFGTVNSTRRNSRSPTLGELQAKTAPRDNYEFKISTGFLLAPLISISKWPLPWDPFFRPLDTIQLQRQMGLARPANSVDEPLCERSLPRNSLGDSKKLHFTTKRGNQWLINAVEQGLEEMGIQHAEQYLEPSIMCCLHQQRHGISLSEGVEIRFSKLPFREVHGIKVTDVKYATRGIGSSSHFRDTSDFRAVLTGILERAEANARNAP